MSMSIEDAIEAVSEQVDYIRDTAKKFPNSKSAKVVGGFDMALSALREKQEREKRPITNGDRIRGMGNEEMAEFLAEYASRNLAWMEEYGTVLGWLGDKGDELTELNKIREVNISSEPNHKALQQLRPRRRLTCLECDCYDGDREGCTMSSMDRSYACSLEADGKE